MERPFIKAGNTVIGIAHIVKIEPNGVDAVNVTLSNGTVGTINVPGTTILARLDSYGLIYDPAEQ